MDAYAKMMGFKQVAVAPGDATFEADVDARWHNPTGRLHGGVLSGLADTAMGAAVLAMPEVPAATNMDLGMRFLSSVVEGTITARARVVKKGRRIVFMACDVHQGDRLVASAHSQFIVL